MSIYDFKWGYSFNLKVHVIQDLLSKLYHTNKVTLLTQYVEGIVSQELLRVPSLTDVTVPTAFKQILQSGVQIYRNFLYRRRLDLYLNCQVTIVHSTSIICLKISMELFKKL